MPKRLLGIFVFVLLSFYSVSANAAFQPHLTSTELQTYYNMKKTDPASARAYLITRDYVSECKQALQHQNQILELRIEPKEYSEKYVTQYEKYNIVKKAIRLWMYKMIGQR